MQRRSRKLAIAIERDEAGLDRIVSQPQAIAHLELLENLVEMRLYGALTDRQMLRDLGIAKPIRHASNDFRFARGEPSDGRVFLRGKLGLQRRWHPDQTIRDSSDRGHQCFDGEAFLNDSLCTEAQRSHSHLGAFVRGQNDHLCQMRQLRDVVHRGSLHLQVEQQDVAFDAVNDALELSDGFDFRDQFDVFLQAQQRLEPLAKERVIVGNDQANW